MKIIEVEKKPLFFEEEKITPKESKYRSATKLMEAVDCVERFENAVASLEGAAVLFEELKGYKDSAAKAGECLQLAQKAREEGMEAAYQEAVRMQEAARGKLDYRTVISEYKRFSDYKDSSQRIEECKKKIIRMETWKAWQNRAIFLLMLAAAAVLLWISPVKPYAKGMLHMRRGQYKQAVRDFNETNGFIDSDWQKKKCRYKQAVRAYENGNTDKALQYCRLAIGRTEAEDFMAGIELEEMRDARPGQEVCFGTDWRKSAKRTGHILRWRVLENDGKKLLLMGNQLLRPRAFDAETNQWSRTGLRRYLNHNIVRRMFHGGELSLIPKVVTDDKDRGDRMYLLSAQEFERYRKYIPYLPEEEMVSGDDLEWWLRDAGDAADKACYVTPGQPFVEAVEEKRFVKRDGDITEKKQIYPVIQVILDKKLLERE